MDLIKSIFEAGLVIWNTIVGTSIQFFTADPLSFSKTSGQVAIIKDAAGAISTIALPVVAVFFLLALVKELVSTPIEMVPRKLALNLIKYIVICALVANSYELMCTISNISAGIVRMVNASLSIDAYEIEEADLNLDDIEEIKAEGEKTDMEAEDEASWWEKLGKWFSDKANWLLNLILDFLQTTIIKTILYFLGSIIFVFICATSGISILNVAIQRVIKPLVIIPFSAIAFACAAGSQESERVTVSFIKTYVGFVLSGAVILISLAFGSELAGTIGSALVTAAAESDNMTVVWVAQLTSALMTPVVVAGLIKGADGIVRQAIG